MRLNGANSQLVNVRFIFNCEIEPFYFTPVHPASQCPAQTSLWIVFVETLWLTRPQKHSWEIPTLLLMLFQQLCSHKINIFCHDWGWWDDISRNPELLFICCEREKGVGRETLWEEMRENWDRSSALPISCCSPTLTAQSSSSGTFGRLKHFVFFIKTFSKHVVLLPCSNYLPSTSSNQPRETRWGRNWDFCL